MGPTACKHAIAALVSFATYAVVGASCSTTSSNRGSTSDASESDASARSPCSTGPPYTDANALPQVRGSTPLPRCIPRCEAEARVAFFLDAVPSGACSVEHEQCQLLVDEGCSCAPDTEGPQAVVWCECKEAMWHCMLSEPPLAVCGCGTGAPDAEAGEGRDAE